MICYFFADKHSRKDYKALSTESQMELGARGARGKAKVIGTQETKHEDKEHASLTASVFAARSAAGRV